MYCPYTESELERYITTKNGVEYYVYMTSHCGGRCYERMVLPAVVFAEMKQVVDFLEDQRNIMKRDIINNVHGEEMVLFLKEYKISFGIKLYPSEIMIKTTVSDGYCKDGIMRTGENERIILVDGGKISIGTMAQLGLK